MKFIIDNKDLYPTILQYIETLSNPRQLLKTVRDLRLVLDNNDEPIFSSGNFGAVFKVDLGNSFKAIKCFTREQSGRKTAYKNISANFENTPPHTINFDYLDSEISVFYQDGTLFEFPVVIMDWVDGETLDLVIHKAAIANDTSTLSRLSIKFDHFAKWLLNRPFAHGDLKPENILLSPDFELVMVDYDGMYLPNMEGQIQREIGTYGFQHPLRSQMLFCKAIDDYSIALLSIMLKVLAKHPQFYFQYGFGISTIFDPANILKGTDPCYNYLLKTDFATDPLFGALLCDDPIIKNLHEFLKPSDVVYLAPSKEEFTPLKKCCSNSKQGFVDQRNNIVIAPKYATVCDFTGGFALVCLHRRWGVIDENGKVVVSIIYDQIRNCSEGLFAVCLSNKWGYVSINGINIIPLRFDNVWSFRCGRGLVKKDEKYGFVDKTGKVVIPIRFEYAQSYTDNYACIKKDGFFGYIDLNGKWGHRPMFTYAESIQNGIAKASTDAACFEIQLGQSGLTVNLLKDQTRNGDD